MAEGILGLGQGQAASLNNELIEKLKSAESSARVDPIETDLLEIETEELALTGIKDKINELLEAIKPFDLFVTGGVNAFDTKYATTTGESVAFEASDEGKLDIGTTTIDVTSLATKDVYQSNTISDKSEIQNSEDDVITIAGQNFTVAQIDGEEDFATLASNIDGLTDVSASFADDKITIVDSSDPDDVKTTSFSTTSANSRDLAEHIATNTNLTATVDYIEINGEVFSTDGEDYEKLAETINANENVNYLATYDKDANTFTIDIDGDTGTTGDVQTFSTYRMDYNEFSAEIDAKSENNSLTTNAKYITINDEVISTLDRTYEEIAEEINKKSGFNASLEEVATDTYRMVIKSSEPGLDNALTIKQDGFSLGLETPTVTSGDTIDGIYTFTIDNGDDPDSTFSSTSGMTYETFIGLIDADPNFVASIDPDDGAVQISKVDGSSVNVTTDELGLFNANHTLTATNLTAVVDGIDYDVSSNEIIVGGGLKITALEEGISSITVDNDTLSLEPLVQNIVAKYNELVTLIDAEVLEADGALEDKSAMNSIMTDIRNKLFGSYGPDGDQNMFNFGFELDKSGILTLDSETFNDAVLNDLESLRTLFIGDAVDEGLGTQMKKYVDALDGFGGLITAYEDNMTERKETLTEDKEKAVEDLDSKYSQLAQQFASYSVIINQMEASFSGLKMMIQQSVASN